MAAWLDGGESLKHLLSPAIHRMALGFSFSPIDSGHFTSHQLVITTAHPFETKWIAGLDDHPPIGDLFRCPPCQGDRSRPFGMNLDISLADLFLHEHLNVTAPQA